jgi:hypothetical protein
MRAVDRAEQAVRDVEGRHPVVHAGFHLERHRRAGLARGNAERGEMCDVLLLAQLGGIERYRGGPQHRTAFSKRQSADGRDEDAQRVGAFDVIGVKDDGHLAVALARREHGELREVARETE